MIIPVTVGSAAARAGDGRGRTRIFNREKKRQNSVDVIHAVLFLCGDGDGTAHSGKMILKTGRSVSKYAGSLI